jgi:hypothetical protein
MLSVVMGGLTLSTKVHAQNPTPFPNGIPNYGDPIVGFDLSRLILPFGPKSDGDPWIITQTGNFGATHNCPAAPYQPNCGAIDLGLPEGTPLYAVFDGWATFKSEEDSGGFGNLVIIQHPDLLEANNDEEMVYSIYAHLKSISIPSDAWVKQGQKIGESGKTGNAVCGGNTSGCSHLHFGMSKSVLDTNDNHETVPISLNEYPGITWDNPEDPDRGCPDSFECGSTPRTPVFFSDESMKGNSQAIGFSINNLQNSLIGNDSIRSLRVPKGFTIELYSDINYGGRKRKFIGPLVVNSLKGGKVRGKEASSIWIDR